MVGRLFADGQIGGQGRDKIPRPIANIVAAALAGFDITFIGKNIIGVFYGDHTNAAFLRHQPLGGELTSGGINAVCDLLPQHLIKLKIGGFGILRVEISFHLVSFFLLNLIILLYPVLAEK